VPARSPGDRVLAVAVAAVSLAIYVRSLLPGTGFSGDTAKWQFLGAVGGVPHPTGYPLYLALNGAFVRLVPFGSLAWRANLLSAVCAAAAVAVLFLLLRTLGVRPWIAAATALTFAVVRTFWTQAVVAEVYTLHILFLVGIALCLARWRAGGRDAWLFGAFGLVALSFGNHLGTVLVLPLVVWVCLSDPRRALTLRTVGVAGVAAVVALAQYAWLLHLARVGQYVEQPVRNLEELRTLMAGGRFRSHMMAFPLSEMLTDRVVLLWGYVRRDVGLLLVPAAVGAIVALLGRRGPPVRHVAAGLVLVAVAVVVHALGYEVIDVYVFLLPAYVAVAVLGGLGLDQVARAWPRARAARLVGAACLVALPLAGALLHYRQASQRGNVADHRYIEHLVTAAPAGSVFITDNYEDSEYVWYFLLGEGLREERRLDIVNQATPQEVADHVWRGRGRLASVAGRDRPVVVVRPHQAAELRKAGLAVEPMPDGGWQVRGPGTAGR